MDGGVEDVVLVSSVLAVSAIVVAVVSVVGVTSVWGLMGVTSVWGLMGVTASVWGVSTNVLLSVKGKIEDWGWKPLWAGLPNIGFWSLNSCYIMKVFLRASKPCIFRFIIYMSESTALYYTEHLLGVSAWYFLHVYIFSSSCIRKFQLS